MSMEYYKRLNDHYDRGLQHGLIGKYKPGPVYGKFRKAYIDAYEQGVKLRRLRDFKTK